MHCMFMNILINTITYLFIRNSYIILAFIIQGGVKLFCNFILLLDLCDFFFNNLNVTIKDIDLNLIELKLIVKNNFNLDYNELRKNSVNSVSKLSNDGIDSQLVIILACFIVCFISICIIINNLS